MDTGRLLSASSGLTPYMDGHLIVPRPDEPGTIVILFDR